MKLILTLFINIIFLPYIYAQSEEQIRNVDKVRQEIDNNLENYEKTEKQNDRAGNKYIYLLDKELKLITVETYGKKISKMVRWYFENDQLILSEQVLKNAKSNKLVDDQKFYISNNHLIAWYKFENKMDPASIEFKNADNQLSIEIDGLKDDIIIKK